MGDVQITEAVRRNVADVLDSAFLSPGKWCRRFEREWAELHDRRHAVFVNSGTSALQIALAALREKYGWPDGFKVIVPALTFVASVNVVLQNRLLPVFMDIDEFFGIVPDRNPPPDTVAIMAVHINGQQCAMDVVSAYANLHNLVIIEDSCETVAAHYGGKVAGSWGEVAAFSTYACHHVTTGVGGFALTDDQHVAMLMRSFANHGRDGIYFSPSPITAEVIERRFNFERVGYSYRATEFEAAVGCGLLETLEENLAARRDNANWLNVALADLPLELPGARPGADWWPMFMPILSPMRDRLEVFLEAGGIETRRMLPLTNQPIYRELVREADFPTAARVNRDGLYVGIQPGIDVERIADAFWSYFERAR